MNNIVLMPYYLILICFKFQSYFAHIAHCLESNHLVVSMHFCSWYITLTMVATIMTLIVKVTNRICKSKQFRLLLYKPINMNSNNTFQHFNLKTSKNIQNKRENNKNAFVAPEYLELD